jgi:hypothetical protein
VFFHVIHQVGVALRLLPELLDLPHFRLYIASQS